MKRAGTRNIFFLLGFRRQVGVPLRPSALPLGISFTSLRSSSIVSNSKSKGRTTRFNIITKTDSRGVMLDAKFGPLSVKCQLSALLSS